MWSAALSPNLHVVMLRSLTSQPRVLKSRFFRYVRTCFTQSTDLPSALNLIVVMSGKRLAEVGSIF